AFAYNNRYIYQKDTILVCLNRALRYFDQVDRVYQESDVTLGEGSFQTTVKMSKLFKFPGLASLSAQQQPFLDYYTIENFKNKGIFLEYILQVRNLAAFYNSKDEAEYLNDFLLSYFSTHLLNMENEPEVNLKALEAMTVRNGLNEAIDRDALLAFFTVYYNSKGQSSKAAEFEKRIDLKRLMNKDKFENEDRSPKYYRLARSLVNYYLEQPVQFEDEPEQNRTFSEQYTKAFALIALFPNPFQRRNTLLRNIDSLQLANKVAVAISLLDTLINTDVVRTTKFGNQLFVILGRLSTTDGDKLALNLLKDRSDKVKQFCLNYFVQGKSEIGNYFEASTFIPEYVSSSSQLQLYTTIIKSELKRKQEPVLSGWSYMDRLYPDNNLLTGAFEETENQVLFTSSD
ncbi:MAG TPA: hypothetical protein PLQ93_12440, partial [Bacteroidia bacterium]|nr:hypothetical protein [Bacteroidia bacterium]